MDAQQQLIGGGVGGMNGFWWVGVELGNVALA